mgnify:FL=1|jgi:hypothetical protein
MGFMNFLKPKKEYMPVEEVMLKQEEARVMAIHQKRQAKEQQQKQRPKAKGGFDLKGTVKTMASNYEHQQGSGGGIMGSSGLSFGQPEQQQYKRVRVEVKPKKKAKKYKYKKVAVKQKPQQTSFFSGGI